MAKTLKICENKTTMKKEKKLLRIGKDFFIPPDKATWEEFREVLPFFVMMTMALAWLYVVNVQQLEDPFWIGAFSVVMLVHLGVYWAVFNFVGSDATLRLYFILQGALAVTAVLIVEDIGLIIGLFGSLIGNTVGVLQRPKMIFFVISLYLIVALMGILHLAGTDVLFSWSAVAIPALLFSGFIAYLFRRQLDAREKTQKLLEELQEAHEKLAAYTDQVEELTRSAERQRMARELHDTLAQGLAGLILQLEAVSTHIAGGNHQRAQKILQDAMAQSRTTLTEARMVIADLRSDGDSYQSFDEAIRAEVRRFKTVSGIPCEVVIQHSHPPPEWAREHILKIISEGLNNIAKHASASQAWLRLVETKTKCEVEIEDNGRGFLVSEAFDKEGRYGLLGVQERVELLKGTLSITSAPGDGTCITVLVPLEGEVMQDE
jgi:NarL family two-component system sensor histidine kinase YdfH